MLQLVLSQVCIKIICIISIMQQTNRLIYQSVVDEPQVGKYTSLSEAKYTPVRPNQNIHIHEL